MLRAIVCVLALLLASPSYSGENMPVELVRVVDGDTIVVNIPDWPDVVGHEIGVRVAGCDTPELRDKRPEIKAMAYRAKQAVMLLLQDAEQIELSNIQRGKYFRLVADVYADDINVAFVLISAGLAQPYDGGTRPAW